MSEISHSGTARSGGNLGPDPTCTHANDGIWPEARPVALRGGPCSYLAGPGLELTRTFLADSEALFPNNSFCFASGRF